MDAALIVVVGLILIVLVAMIVPLAAILWDEEHDVRRGPRPQR